jgi:hypothetical protein
MDVCLCLFCVCIGSGLLTGWSLVQGVLPSVFGLRKWSETKRFTDAPWSKVGATWEGGGKRERESSIQCISSHPATLRSILIFQGSINTAAHW